MQDVINSPRVGCALHGAVQTVRAIRGAVPIVHANSGCAVSNYLANRAAGTDAGSLGGYSVPGTDALERHIIFGGASRLREQIKNTLKVIRGDLYVVLNSCEAAMVGDDLDAMTREAQEQGEPVIDSLAAGFHGDAYYGYENVVADILKKLPAVRSIERRPKQDLVNIFGVVPGRDLHCRGTLEELARLVGELGVEANLFFGPENGVEDFANAQNAGLSLVFSKWGLKAAEQLKETYGVPVLPFLTVPVGPEQTEALLDAVGTYFGIPEATVAAVCEKERRYFQSYFESLLEDVYAEHAGKDVALVGDAGTVLSLSAFLRDYFGAAVKGLVVTDLTQEDFDAVYGADGRQAAQAFLFSRDSVEISAQLREWDAEFLLGSSLEEPSAAETGVPFLPISYPAYHQTIANKTYAGVRGALTAAEDFLTALKRAGRERNGAFLNGNGR